MTPALASLNSGDGIFQNPVFSGDKTLQSVVGPNRDDLMGFEFCRAASLAAIGCSMQVPVGHVVHMNIPSQIGELVVLGVSVIVATFAAFGRWANEGLKHQSMNAHGFAFITAPEKQHETSSSAIPSWLFFSHRSGVSDIAKIRYIVKTFVANHRFPYFHKTDYPALMGMVQG